MVNNKKIPQLCEADRCTACSACYNICPRFAISMETDKYGESHPVVDDSRCIGCGLCEKVCPVIDDSKISRHGNPDIYCCWLKDAQRRKESTSGGAAFSISETIIKKGGHVWGASYDENMEVHYVEANTVAELTAIQKSKYAQSIVSDSFEKIKKELDNGDLVLFAGTGCHVMGLRSFLRRDYDNLYTLDLVCHGVPGQGVFQKYRKWIENRYGDTMTAYIPRPKRESDGQEIGYYALAKFKHIGDIRLEGVENSYFVGFQHNLFLRSACHHCMANGEKRFSDFTVADFWGLGKVVPFKPYKERTLGISMLALNSAKAKSLFEEFKDSLVYELRSYEEASYTNVQYYKSSNPSPMRDRFRQDFSLFTWDELAERYMQTSVKEKTLYCIKKFTPPHLLLYVKLLAKWIK